jgi:hypothetical protein
MQFEEVLRTFAAFFEREQIRYAVIGGLAMRAWGQARMTKDVDFVVDLDSRERVIAYAESIGYETLHVSDGFSNHLHKDDAFGRIDFMYASGTTAEKIFGAVVRKGVIGETTLPVASAEHLAMMKAIAMKNFPHRALFEGDDIRVLLNVPGVDRAAIRDYYARQGLLELYDAIEKASRTA